jgi:predicted metal-binding protein
MDRTQGRDALEAPRGATTPPVELLVCATCRIAGPDGPKSPTQDHRPGTILADSLPRFLPEGVTLRMVDCLSNCSRGCTIALRGPGRWTYVYGNLDPDQHLEAIATGAALYRDAPGGLVPWRERPEHFKRNCIARIPPMETIDD